MEFRHQKCASGSLRLFGLELKSTNGNQNTGTKRPHVDPGHSVVVRSTTNLPIHHWQANPSTNRLKRCPQSTREPVKSVGISFSSPDEKGWYSTANRAKIKQKIEQVQPFYSSRSTVLFPRWGRLVLNKDIFESISSI